MDKHKVNNVRDITMTVPVQAGKMTVKVKFGNIAQRLTRSLNDGQKAFDNEVMKLMAPYMQHASGEMIRSMQRTTILGSGEIIVNTPYARRQYYSKSKVGRPSGALRGPFYFERMKAEKKDQIERAIAGRMKV